MTTTTAPDVPAGITRRARRVVASAAIDAADARRLLTALGIGPGWAEQPRVEIGRGPVTRRYPDPIVHAAPLGRFV